MAWTEQCKIAFTTTADALYYRQQGRKNKTAILKQLAEDTDISVSTLKKWWIEASRTKTGPTDSSSGNKKENNDKVEDGLCIECNKNPKRNGGKLCSSCENKKTRDNKLKQLKSLISQIKAITETIKKEGTAEVKWKGKVRKNEYEQLINTLIQTIKVWEEMTK